MLSRIRKASKRKGIPIYKYINPDSSVMEIATKGDLLITIEPRATVADLLSLMIHKGVRRVPVVNESTKNFFGLVSTTDMLNFLGAGPKASIFRKAGENGLETPVEKIMEKNVLTLQSSDTISEAINLMRSHDIGGLPIISGKKISGFISERDIVRKIKGRLGFRVQDVMINKPFFIKPDYPLIDVAKLIVHGPYRRLPVAKDGILLGMVTPFDILKHLNKKRKLRDISKERTKIMVAMNPNTIYTKPRQKLCKALEIMTRHRIGGMPVVSGDEMDIIGILTERDIIDILK